MAAPKSDPPKCDVHGCGALAENMTDGTEVDSTPLGRKAIPHLNLCGHHAGWAFSEDAKAFTTSGDTAAKYQARAKVK